jgi:hypothetical protein
MPTYQYRKLKDGRKVRITVPHYSDYDVPPAFMGGQDTDFGIGPGVSAGQLWMNTIPEVGWFYVYLTGSAAVPSALTMSVSQSQLMYSSSDAGYQYVKSTDGNYYAIYLTGQPPVITISQSGITAGTGFGKESLILKSISDGNYYSVNLTTTAGKTTASIGSNIYASGSWVGYY